MNHLTHKILTCAVAVAATCCCLPAKAATPSDRKPFPGGKCCMYRISLTDKQGTPFAIDRPEEFLSPKAIERRRRQALPIDSTDLPINPAYVLQVQQTGARVMRHSKWNNTLLVCLSDTSALATLRTLPFVASARRVWTAPDSVKPSTRVVYNKELQPKDNAPDDPYGAAYSNIGLLNGQPLHQKGYRGKGITIAVFDGGFMNADRIPALKRVSVLGTRDFVAFPSKTVFAELDHGTKVLSTMALDQPGIFVGTAPEADFWLIRTEDNATESLAEEDYWAEAAEFADSVGVDIISSSLGYQDFDDKHDNHRYAELDGDHALISRTASRLAAKGIVHVNSAGNDGNDTWKKINFPADARDILAVGAVKPSRVNANFSSVGPSQDGRVKPDVMALGSPAAVLSGRGAINYDMGTSFSAPIVTGMVACLWQAVPQATASQVMEAVRRSGDCYDTPNNVFGYGVPDFDKALGLLRAMTGQP